MNAQDILRQCGPAVASVREAAERRAAGEPYMVYALPTTGYQPPIGSCALCGQSIWPLEWLVDGPDGKRRHQRCAGQEAPLAAASR